MHAIFYKKYWDLLGDDLVTEVLEAINLAKYLKGGMIQ